MAEGNEAASTMGFFLWAGKVMASVTMAVARAPFEDRHLAGAGRQGIDELGMALRAFPESIQASEYGTIWNPTPGEIDESRRADLLKAERDHDPKPPTPSEIVRQSRQSPQPGRGREHGQERARE